MVSDNAASYVLGWPALQFPKINEHENHMFPMGIPTSGVSVVF